MSTIPPGSVSKKNTNTLCYQFQSALTELHCGNKNPLTELFAKVQRDLQGKKANIAATALSREFAILQQTIEAREDSQIHDDESARLSALMFKVDCLSIIKLHGTRPKKQKTRIAETEAAGKSAAAAAAFPSSPQPTAAPAAAAAADAPFIDISAIAGDESFPAADPEPTLTSLFNHLFVLTKRKAKVSEYNQTIGDMLKLADTFSVRKPQSVERLKGILSGFLTQIQKSKNCKFCGHESQTANVIIRVLDNMDTK